MKYLNYRYNYYLRNSKLSADYRNSYDTLRTQLLALKADLETNVKKDTSQVDKLNQEVITSMNFYISDTP